MVGNSGAASCSSLALSREVAQAPAGVSSVSWLGSVAPCRARTSPCRLQDAARCKQRVGQELQSHGPVAPNLPRACEVGGEG